MKSFNRWMILALLIGSIFIPVIVSPSIVFGDLKEFIPIVKVRYHSSTIETFNSIGRYFEQSGDYNTADFFYSFADGGGWEEFYYNKLF